MNQRIKHCRLTTAGITKGYDTLLSSDFINILKSLNKILIQYIEIDILNLFETIFIELLLIIPIVMKVILRYDIYCILSPFRVVFMLIPKLKVDGSLKDCAILLPSIVNIHSCLSDGIL